MTLCSICKVPGCDSIHPEVPEPEVPAFYTVAVYLVDRAYGGPEEGGWYYTKSEIVYNLEEGCKNVALPQIFATGEEAEEAAKLLEEGPLTRLNEGRPQISSVLSQGRYDAKICENFPEPFFPKERPQYG